MTKKTPKLSDKPTLTVKQDEADPVPKEVLATAIRDISAAMERLVRSGLNQRAVVALIQDDTGLPKTKIQTVLASLETLERRYCR